MPKKYYGVDRRRGKVFGRFYREEAQPLKKDLVDLEELETKLTKRGRVARSKPEQDKILAHLYYKKEQELAEAHRKAERFQSLAVVFDAWLDSISQTREKKTFLHYQKSVDWFFKANPRRLATAELSGRHFDNMGALIAREATEITANSHLRSMRAGLRWAFKNKYLAFVPPITMYRLTKTPPIVFEVEDLERMREILFERREKSRRWENLLRAFYILRWTGIRAGELLFLEWENVDLRDAEIFLLSSDDYRLKGRRAEGVPIADPLLEFLETVDHTGERFVLDDGKGGRYWDTRPALSRSMKRFQKEIGVAGPKSLHGFRATLATMLGREPNANISDIQRLLRHTSISTTLGYIKKDDRNLRGMLGRLSGGRK